MQEKVMYSHPTLHYNIILCIKWEKIFCHHMYQEKNYTHVLSRLY